MEAATPATPPPPPAASPACAPRSGVRRAGLSAGSRRQPTSGGWVVGGVWWHGNEVVGERVEVEALDERSRQRPTDAAPRAGPTGSRTVLAPMPGLVVRIEVAAGQPVAAGAGLVVVEAMKMENELRAPHSGVVATVHVAVGQAVERGAPLVTLASPEPSG